MAASISSHCAYLVLWVDRLNLEEFPVFGDAVTVGEKQVHGFAGGYITTGRRGGLPSAIWHCLLLGIAGTSSHTHTHPHPPQARKPHTHQVRELLRLVRHDYVDLRYVFEPTRICLY